jgi:hypothetical protein
MQPVAQRCTTELSQLLQSLLSDKKPRIGHDMIYCSSSSSALILGSEDQTITVNELCLILLLLVSDLTSSFLCLFSDDGKTTGMMSQKLYKRENFWSFSRFLWSTFWSN